MKNTYQVRGLYFANSGSCLDLLLEAIRLRLTEHILNLRDYATAIRRQTSPL